MVSSGRTLTTMSPFRSRSLRIFMTALLPIIGRLLRCIILRLVRERVDPGQWLFLYYQRVEVKSSGQRVRLSVPQSRQPVTRLGLNRAEPAGAGCKLIVCRNNPVGGELAA